MIPQEQKLSLAKEAGRKKNYAEAIQHINSFLAEDPDNAEACFMRGVAFYHLGNSEDARSDFARVLYQQPDHKYARQWLDKIDQERAPATINTFEYDSEPSAASEYGQTAYPEYESPVRAKPVPSKPKAFLWPFYLYFRPKVFFEHFTDCSSALMGLFAWMMGLGLCISRVDFYFYHHGKRLSLHDIASQSWGQFWPYLGAYAIFVTIIVYLIGGWWYRLRIRFSGGGKVDAYVSRRVYIFSYQVFVIPIIIRSIFETFCFATPLEAKASESLLYDIFPIIGAILLLWSSYISYRGVRVCFEVRKWAARIWFIIIPVLYYAALAAFVIFLATYAVFSSLQETGSTQTVTHKHFTFQMPEEWVQFRHPDNKSPEQCMMVGPKTSCCVTGITVYNNPDEPDQYYEKKSKTSKETIKIERYENMRWGNYSGHGMKVIHNSRSGKSTSIIFIAENQSPTFAIQEACMEGMDTVFEPGLEMIRESFQLK